MKDEQLIRALVKDLKPARSMPGFAARFTGFLLWCVLVIGMAAAAADVFHTPSALPAVLALLMLLAAAAGAIVSVIPGRSWRGALGLTTACAMAWLVTGGVRAWDLPPAAAWGVMPWTKCLVFTAGIALVAAAGLIPVLRRGWPVQPAVTLALALAAGGAAGALATTIECASVAPLHELAGHLLPVVLLAILGAITATLVARRRAFGELL